MEIKSPSELVQHVVHILGSDIVERLARELKDRDKVATGNLIDSLEWDVRQLLSDFQLTFSAEDYERFIESGRRPGSFPPVKAIKAWIDAKGLDLNEYAVAKNIWKNGIKPTPYVDDILSSGIIDDSVKQIEDVLANDVEYELVKLVQQLNTK
jgi:hypothetical protein